VTAAARKDRGRPREVRSVVINVERLSRKDLRALAVGRVEFPPEALGERPRTRGECEEGVRPCPFVSCKYHLYLDASRVNGSIKLNFPDLEVGEMQDSCTLDVADGGGATLERVGHLMNLTRERVRQVEQIALARVGAAAPLFDWLERGGSR
jgi:hypothetical protein